MEYSGPELSQKRKNKTVAIFIENYIAGGSDKIARDLIDDMDYESLYLFVNRTSDTSILLSSPLPKNTQLVHYNILTLVELGVFANQFKERSQFFYLVFKILNVIVRYPLILLHVIYFSRLFRKYKINILFSNNGGYPGGECNRAATLSASLVCQKNYHIIHSLATKPFLKVFTPIEYMIDYILDIGSTIICVSNQTKDVLLQQRFIRQNPIIIYNGVKAKRDIIKDFTAKRDKLKLLSIGILGKIKNQLFIIEALHILKEKGFDAIELYIVGKEGDSDYLKMLQDKVDEYQLCVHFEGFSSNPSYYYDLCDVFVLSSTVESFALVRVEAMSVGMPVVTTDVGDAHKQVKNGVNGFIVDSPEAMALAIQKYILLPNLIIEHAQNGYAIYKNDFTRDKMIGQYQELISKD
ncbi:glycosyltransferase family 4 protein [Sulfurospirillum arsenophilum]|uniref:glycosyltransferase family 4 protein n=1 Tax=Sulfurospirillum arsenophilum TaxID=56698 RepID=UPI0005AA2418|nr:glycosyltransferase family 4 protein [Sulfurospirillum arsenophilum]